MNNKMKKLYEHIIGQIALDKRMILAHQMAMRPEKFATKEQGAVKGGFCQCEPLVLMNRGCMCPSHIPYKVRSRGY